MAAQKAPDIRRVVAEVEANASCEKNRGWSNFSSVAAETWPEVVAKARYVLNLYLAILSSSDTHHRDLVTTVLADLTRPGGEH